MIPVESLETLVDSVKLKWVLENDFRVLDRAFWPMVALWPILKKYLNKEIKMRSILLVLCLNEL